MARGDDRAGNMTGTAATALAAILDTAAETEETDLDLLVGTGGPKMRGSYRDAQTALMRED